MSLDRVTVITIALSIASTNKIQSGGSFTKTVGMIFRKFS